MPSSAAMRTDAERLLEPGEQVEEVAFAPRTTPYLVLLPAFALLAPFLDHNLVLLIGFVAVMVIACMTSLVVIVRGYRVLCWTDRALVEFAGSRVRGRPTAILRRLPRDLEIGSLRGTWAKVDLAGESLYLHRRFHGAVDRAEGRGRETRAPARH